MKWKLCLKIYKKVSSFVHKLSVVKMKPNLTQLTVLTKENFNILKIILSSSMYQLCHPMVMFWSMRWISKFRKEWILLSLDLMVVVKALCSEFWVDFGILLVVSSIAHICKNYSIFLNALTFLQELWETK